MIALYQSGFLNIFPESIKNATNIFWESFAESFKQNKKGSNGKMRVLSIIVQNFTYRELNENLGVIQFYLFYLFS